MKRSSGGVPGGSLAAGREHRRFPDKHPLGLSPNITGLMMVIAYDFDQSGQLVQSRVNPRPHSSTLATPAILRRAPQSAESPRPAPLPAPLAPRPRPADLKLDHQRDQLLTGFGKTTLTDRYIMPGERFQDMFARVACAFADDIPHAQRLYDAMSQLWFMPATPVLSNGGTARGLPISCFLNAVSDSLAGIVATWNENVWLASNGGGIGWQNHGI
jgi:ribonucleoside-diphosphate reductase alpha chain